MSKYDEIRAALEVRLNQTVSIPLAWENVKFEPTTGTPYILVRQIPTSKRPAVVGPAPQERYQGVFQLLFKFPTNKGSGPTQEAIDPVLQAFAPTTDLSFTKEGTTTYVTLDYVEQNRAYTEGSWYTTPVNIGWHSYN